MSLVWGFVKDNIGHIFSDGKTTNNSDNYNKVNKEKNLVGQEFLFGITGYLDLNKTNTSASHGPQSSCGSSNNSVPILDEIQSFLKQATAFITDSNFIDIFKNYFNNNFSNNTYSCQGDSFILLITPNKTLVKFDIKNNVCSVNIVKGNNESIGDHDSYESRMVFFKSVFNDDDANDYHYSLVFNDVKNNICSNDKVGGQTFYGRL